VEFPSGKGSANTYYIYLLGCQKYLSAQGCRNGTLELAGATGKYQEFRLQPTRGNPDEYGFQAVACNQWIYVNRCESDKGSKEVDVLLSGEPRAGSVFRLLAIRKLRP
jgi:hypothetical protein